MLSTMQDVPLLISRILTHGSTIHGTSQVTTWTGEDEPHRRSFAEIGARAAQLAHALKDDLGVTGDERVATLAWNNAEHVEAYFAIPSMGAVLHTLNLRLPPEQLAWIVNHAADRVIIANGSLLPLLAPLLPHLKPVEHVVVTGPGDRSLLDGAGVRVHEYEDLIAGKPTSYDWPELDERQAAAMCYTSGTTGDPKGVVYSHRSVYLHSMQVNMAQSMGLTDQDTSLVVVPQFHNSERKGGDPPGVADAPDKEQRTAPVPRGRYRGRSMWPTAPHGGNGQRRAGHPSPPGCRRRGRGVTAVRGRLYPTGPRRGRSTLARARRARPGCSATECRSGS